MSDHIIFFDGECGFCNESVQFVLKRDKDKQFLFAPLQGETAKEWIPAEYRTPLQTSVLVEGYKTPQPKIYYFGKGAFRTLWLLGGFWKLLGWPFFLPAILYDWGYRLVARYRKSLISSCPTNPDRNDQFLP